SGGEAMVTDSSGLVRTRLGRSLLGAFACLWVILPAVFVATPAAQSAMINSVGPRLPTNIGPRGPSIDNIGPRYDSTTRGNGGNGQGGGNNSNSSNANSSSGGSSVGGNTGGSKKQAVVRRARSGVPPGNERRYFPDRVVFELNGSHSDPQVAALLNRFR